MGYSFDEIIPRKNTNSLKYDFADERGGAEDALPLWVADMDFAAPPCVTDALARLARHGIFGYSEVKADYFDLLYQWFSVRFGFEPKAGWLVKTPGVVFAIAAAVRAFTEKGDPVLIQRPAYYPFSEVIHVNGRRLINNPLVYQGQGAYRIDFADFERKIAENNVKLFILCSPHNPVGRVWTREELAALGDICLRHGCLVVSDEIHCDFIYPGHTHTVLASLKPEFLNNTITCTAPSKTFNLAGLQISNIFIADESLRVRFKHEIERTGFSQLNGAGLTACMAAYRGGGPWLKDLNQYLADNLEFLRTFLFGKIPGIRMVEPEGTYLVWLDCRGLNLPQPELDSFMLREAKLWLDSGTIFGPEGEGFMRINIACPRKVLDRALGQLLHAVRTHFQLIKGELMHENPESKS
ncbi:MAG: pyridoxal phosphate-dependent aminotransferase [Clostridiales bacterium]|jgi:cystathionine beta-lyase|nr:pyridoxal phosphate-dependent aminotransferase [Clostridiales bacterium]